MRDIGEGINMNYKCSISGAYTKDLEGFIVNEYDYSNSVDYEDYDIHLVVSELENNRPVIMDGFTTRTSIYWWWFFIRYDYENGHAWVTDGYRYAKLKYEWSDGQITDGAASEYFLHMNWGWDGHRMGSADNYGWYSYDDFTISNGENYQYKQNCLVGIKP